MPSIKSLELARTFHVEPMPAVCFTSTIEPHIPSPGEIHFLTGPSGSGKSSLLRAIKAAKPDVLIDLADVRPPDVSVIDCLQSDVPASLRLLADVGLAEVDLCFKTPSQLSEGQHWRLRLAMLFERVIETPQPKCVICDEFCALLDTLSASVVARQLRKFVWRHKERVSAIVASSRDDFAPALAADRITVCDFDSSRISTSPDQP